MSDHSHIINSHLSIRLYGENKVSITFLKMVGLRKRVLNSISSLDFGNDVLKSF